MKKPRRKYWPRDPRPPLFEVYAAFRPIYSLLDQLKTGYVDVAIINGRESAYFVDPESGDRQPAAPCLRVWINFFERLLSRNKLSLDLWPLRKLCNKLDYGVMLTTAEVAEAGDLVGKLRVVYRNSPIRVIADCALTEQVAIRLEDLQGAAA